jgi:hypothetical protein
MAPPAGTLEKLLIKAFSDPEFSASAGEYEADINPEKFTHNHSISYTDPTNAASEGNTPKFKSIGPESVSFTLQFDATGIITMTQGRDVVAAIDALKTVTYTYVGNIHRSNYLLISWGTFVFPCTLDSLNVNYTMFKSDGTPLRATVDVSFKAFLNETTRKLIARKASPDLTHQRLLTEGFSLPLLAKEVYNDPGYYFKLAVINDLDTFRRIKSGTKIVLPPLLK